MRRFFLCSQNNDSKNYGFIQSVFPDFVAANFFKKESRSPRGFLPRPLLRAGETIAPPPLPQKNSGGAHHSGFSAKKVRISTKRHRQFRKFEFWEDVASALRASAGARSAPDPDFARICHAPRGEKERAWFWIWKFVCAKRKAKRNFADQSFFVSPLAKHGSDNFNILTAPI